MLLDAEIFPLNLRHRRQIFASLAAASGMLTTGSIIGWTSAALPSIKQTSFPFIRPDQESWIGSIVPLAALIAGPIFGLFVDSMGRKTCMIVTAFLAIFGWFMIGFATTIEHIYFGRFITGLAAGSFILTVPVYVADITEPHLRGKLSTVVQLFSTMGVTAQIVVGAIVDWKWSSFLSMIFPGIFLTLIVHVPESPRYFLDMNHDDEAKTSLLWLRGLNAKNIEDDELIKGELVVMKQSLAELKEQTTSFKQVLLSSRIRVPLTICLVLMMLQQLTGYNAILFYLIEIFIQLGSTHAHFSSIIIAICLPIALMLSTMLMDSVGRKSLLLISTLFVAFSLFVIGSYGLLIGQGYTMNFFGWVPLTAFILFFFMYSLGLGTVPFVIMGEILPNHVIGFASGLTVSTHFIFAFLVTRYFQSFSNTIGIDYTFYFGAVMSLFAFVFVYYIVPETKLKTLEEIQQFFAEVIPSFIPLLNGGNGGADDEERRRDEQGLQRDEGAGVVDGGEINMTNYNTFESHSINNNN